MSRSSTERVSEEEKLMNELSEGLAAIGLNLNDEQTDKLLDLFDEYADKKIALMFKAEEEKRKGVVRVR